MKHKKKIRCFIVEDEENGQEALKGWLAALPYEIEILGLAENVKEGIEGIRDTQPDLVLMDIRLGDELSFEILEALSPNIDFYLIFISAYLSDSLSGHGSQVPLKFLDYAIQAAQGYGIGYLEKPLEFDLLKKEIDKFLEKMEDEEGELPEEKAGSESEDGEEFKGDVVVRNELLKFVGKRIIIIPLDCIIHVESKKNAPNIIWYNDLQKGVVAQVSHNEGMVDLAKKLPQITFFMPNSGSIVNLVHVLKGEVKDNTYELTMVNGDKVVVSARKRREFKKRYL
ncbi:MAG: LytTR family transcriptional regulator DNA-binding domain-containing protein [Bacteroidia bacterium]|nr:LytTR family transcriptional regulator DNA-binding domain-containing protein [Bacteroidia bacterium]